MIDLRAPWRLPEWGLLGLERRSVSEVTNSQQEALAYVQQGSLRGFAQCDAGQTRCRRKPVRAHVISPSAAYSCHGSRTWGSDSEPTIVKLTHTAPTFGSDRGPRGDRRIRSTACVTVPRLGVRPVLWPRGFPSVTGLGSSNSAAARYRLVRCLHRYYAGVRLLRALHHRLTASRLPDAVLAVAR